MCILWVWVLIREPPLPTALTLLVSDNGTDWREVFAAAAMKNPKAQVSVFTFDTAKGRYVRITLKGIYEVAMGELAPYMDDGSISDTPTEPVESKTSEPDTGTPADSAFNSKSDPETEKPKGGFGAVMLS